LRGLEAKLSEAGAVDIRVVSDLLRTEAFETVADLLGLEEGFQEEELVLVEAFFKKVGAGASIQKRIRSVESYADDVLAVLRKERCAKKEDEPARLRPPLPGLKAPLQKAGRFQGGTTSGLAEHDSRERQKWNLRLTRVLSEAGAPMLEGMSDTDMKVVVEMAVGRSRPSTVRLRVRAWEAFSRWLVLNRSRVWPSGPSDMIDYLRAMVDVPAPHNKERKTKNFILFRRMF
jgi:hypothetical protein